MQGLLIENLPDELHKKLKLRAMQNKRSVAKEVIRLLEIALNMPLLEKPKLPAPHKSSIVLTDDWINNAKREGRL